MTTEPAPGGGLILRLVVAMPLLLLGWLVILALVLYAGAPAPAILVPFPPAGFVGAMGEASVTGASSVSLTLRSDAPGLVARAYAAGAWLVLPAGLDACIPGFLRGDTGAGAKRPGFTPPQAARAPRS